MYYRLITHKLKHFFLFFGDYGLLIKNVDLMKSVSKCTIY